MLYDERKNLLALFCKKNAKVYEYELITEDKVTLAEYYGSLTNHFKANGNACLLFENSLLLQRALPLKSTILKASSSFTTQDQFVKIKFKCATPLKLAKKFFAALFSKIVDHINDYGEAQELSSLNESRIYQLQMFQQFWSSEVISTGTHEDGVVIKLYTSRKLVGQRSVYDFFQRELRGNCDRHDCLKIIEDQLIGKTVMTRYNKKSYVIHEVDFSSSPNDLFQDGEKRQTFAEYFKQKYNIEVRKTMQPMLINRVSFEEPSSGRVKNYVQCLIPEFCYPVYSEWDLTDFSSVAFLDFMKCIKSAPMVREILGEWNITFEDIPIHNFEKQVSSVDLIEPQESSSSYATAFTRPPSSMK